MVSGDKRLYPKAEWPNHSEKCRYIKPATKVAHFFTYKECSSCFKRWKGICPIIILVNISVVSSSKMSVKVMEEVFASAICELISNFIVNKYYVGHSSDLVNISAVVFGDARNQILGCTMSNHFLLSGVVLGFRSILSIYCSSVIPGLIMIASRTKHEFPLYLLILIVNLVKFGAAVQVRKIFSQRVAAKSDNQIKQINSNSNSCYGSNLQIDTSSKIKTDKSALSTNQYNCGNEGLNMLRSFLLQQWVKLSCKIFSTVRTEISTTVKDHISELWIILIGIGKIVKGRIREVRICTVSCIWIKIILWKRVICV